MAILSLVLVFLLVLAGGIVRSTGSGMGCPDWPKCFGMIVPPTDVSELPVDYMTIYKEKLHGEVEFNVVKTWIEYLNRLLGALSGLSVLALFVVSFFKFKSSQPRLVLLSLGALILIVLNALLGKYVVDTHLKPGIVTLHMFLAVLVVFNLLIIVFKSSIAVQFLQYSIDSRVQKWLIFCLLLGSFQLLLGTQVREAVDRISFESDFINRGGWIDALGVKFILHRSFSLLVLGFNILFFIRIKPFLSDSVLIKRLVFSILSVVLVEILSGVILSYFSIPPFVQPIHLFLAFLMIGCQFYLLLLIKSTKVSTI
ncbi:MAG: COX15/CtaA family protein [Pseudarcicella sp.]|nr:COX15/CtaA family protein [Pseudarcicella sp.]MBP6409783.1 COX15/CtaA family protein [Pseudarcicella sp.]